MAKKESQLKKLKTALRDSGVSRTNTKKGSIRKNRSDKEASLSKIRERFNPYEVQVNKSKFAVGGRKLKGKKVQRRSRIYVPSVSIADTA